VFPVTSRIAIVLACAAALLSQARAQNQEAPADKKPAAEQPPPARRPKVANPEGDYRENVSKRLEQEYREKFKKPENAGEYWAAIKHEIEVGRFALAGELIKGMLDVTKDEGAKDLLPLEEEDGLSAFLRLRVVPTWVDDPNLNQAIRDKINKETRANVEELIARVSNVLQKYLANADRMKQLIKTLPASDDDRTYAVRQIKRSGAMAVPYLIEALRQTPTTDDLHQILLDTLAQLDETCELPILAALDFKEPGLRIELIGVLKNRADPRAVAELWHIAANQDSGASKQATEALAYFLGTSNLPPAKQALTREAEKYYQHKVTFSNPEAVQIWRAENNQLTPSTANASQAEEYYALRYARQALDIDPAYRPAQLVFLSTALEKGYERAGIDQPLEKGAPEVKELLKVVNGDLVKAVLQRALDERRLPVILGAVRALGDRGETSAARTEPGRLPLLVQALDYPDRRVQLAAADALLRMPGRPLYGAKARVVDVLRRALAGSAAATVLIGDANSSRAETVAQALRKAGFDAVAVRSGREVMSRLNTASDVDAVLVDSGISYPELPFLLGQLRADVNSGLLPVIVTTAERFSESTPFERQQKLQRLADHYRNVWVMPATFSPENLKTAVTTRIAEASGKGVSEEERKASSGLAMYWLKRMATGETPGYDVRPAEGEIINALNSDDLAVLAIEAVGRFSDPEAQRSLARLVLDRSRRPELRAAAALELERNIEQFGARLTSDQVGQIDGLFQALATDPKLSGLRANVALVIGSLRPDAQRTGTRLQRYSPALPSAAPEPVPAPGKEKPDKDNPDTDKSDTDKDKDK
jgi:CheY-like chemotaxis protein